MTERTTSLDNHRGMAAQKATEIRRLRAEVEADQAALRVRQADLEEHLQAIDKLFSPNLLILGGGVSKQPDRFIPRLNVRPRVVAAQLRNDAGIVGAAMAASEMVRT